MQKTCVCAEGKRRQQKTKLKMLWIWTPPWENKLSRTKQHPQALDCQQLPSAWKNFANGFPSGTKTSNKMDLVFPGLNFLNDKQVSKEGKKILVSGWPCGLRHKFTPVKWCYKIISVPEGSVPSSKVLAAFGNWKWGTPIFVVFIIAWRAVTGDVQLGQR